METIGEKLRELRSNKNMSLSELGQVLMASHTTISRWERGLREPSIEILLMYAKYFNVSMDYIFGLEDWWNLTKQLNWLKRNQNL